MDAKAELINYKRAPCDKKLELEVSFLSKRHTKGDNSVIVGLVVPIGRPR
jgi:hypothetical protein